MGGFEDTLKIKRVNCCSVPIEWLQIGVESHEGKLAITVTMNWWIIENVDSHFLNLKRVL
jgi:hypothetical protein